MRILHWMYGHRSRGTADPFGCHDGTHVLVDVGALTGCTGRALSRSMTNRTSTRWREADEGNVVFLASARLQS